MASKKKIGIVLSILFSVSFLICCVMIFISTTKTQVFLRIALNTNNSGWSVIGSTEGNIDSVSLKFDSLKQLSQEKYPDSLDNLEVAANKHS
jgi:hypothetical protein